jgi:hypothetical protein
MPELWHDPSRKDSHNADIEFPEERYKVTTQKPVFVYLQFTMTMSTNLD